MYFIKCKDNIGLHKDHQIIARPNSIIIIASESDPMDWHGSLTIVKPLEEAPKKLLDAYHTFIVRFECEGKHFQGVIRVTESPIDMGLFLWLEFRGVDSFLFR